MKSIKFGDLISKKKTGEKGIAIRQSRDSPFVFATFNPSANWSNFPTYTTEAVNVEQLNKFWFPKGYELNNDELQKWLIMHSPSQIKFLTKTTNGRKLLKRFKNGLISEILINSKIHEK